MSAWEMEILRISEEFNRQMNIIMAIEWVAFGLSMVALAVLVITKLRERRQPHGKH